MNIARWFSYTRLLERELIRTRRLNLRERSEWQAERTRLEEERQRVENVVFQSAGVSAPHRHLLPVPKPRERPEIPRAAGPFAIAARNAKLRQEQAIELDAAVHEAPPTPELSDEEKTRVRNAAIDKGLIVPQVPAAATG